MKKTVLWIFISSFFGIWTIFAQNLLPDEAEIEVKNPITQWEATNLTITMKKNWDRMTSYMWSIFIMITDENWKAINQNEYTLPSQWMYEFTTSDMGTVTFQRWLEIKKEWTFYIEVSDFDDDKTLWQQEIIVQKSKQNHWSSNIEILNPNPDVPLTTEVIDLLAMAPDLKNSFVTIYIDETPIQTSSVVVTDSQGLISYKIPDIVAWKHTLSLEIQDVDWTILWNSKTINFTYSPENFSLFKDISITPESWLMIEDTVDITVNTDELAESVTMFLSDRPENDSIILNKIWNGKFGQKVFLIKTWSVEISLQISASNNSTNQTFSWVKTLNVWWIPTISNITTKIDTWNNTVDISRDAENWTAWSFLLEYSYDENNLEFNKKVEETQFRFTGVPEDQPVYLRITPYRDNWQKHWTASKTIQFVISKPTVTTTQSDTPEFDMPPAPKTCTVQNINTRTKKIWDKYYLVRDKVENVSKYIVYSSPTESISDRVKVYETTDTSYEYPFDHTSEEDIFMYFRIDWVCDEKEELQLSWATKVQVWPSENFFLLLCMTLLIYFGIKLFRQTEE